MKDEPLSSADARRPSLTLRLWLAFVLFVAYPLSTGPVARIYEALNLRPEPLLTIYAPIASMADHSPVLQRFSKWYIFELWGFDPFGSGH